LRRLLSETFQGRAVENAAIFRQTGQARILTRLPSQWSNTLPVSDITAGSVFV
jgi:hypothetical protein